MPADVCTIQSHFYGEPAARATVAAMSLDMPHELLLSYCDRKAYLIMAAGVTDIDLSEAFEHVRSTWKWNASESGAE